MSSADKLFKKTGQLLVVDPGETVGWAWFSKDGDEIALESHGQNGWATFEWELYTELVTYRDSMTILIENYRMRPSTIGANMNRELITVKVIGAIEFIARLYDIPVTFQTPAQQAKQFFSRKRLEKYGMWAKGRQHSRSAIRHGLWYFSFGEGKEK